MKKVGERAALVVCCAAGLAVGGGLLASEIGRTEPIDVGEVREVRRGSISTATFEVRNRTEVAQCVEIRVAARDTESKDLDEVVAGGGEIRVPPGASVPLRADLRIDPQDYDERFSELRAFVYGRRGC
jgi:hypothetical protein